MKRVVVIADLHCGHETGLTPSSEQYSKNSKFPKRVRAAEIQGVLWKFYKSKIDELKPVDILLVNGDAIDGQGLKSGGSEETTPDQSEQVWMAVDCIQAWEAHEIVMTYGTGYHTGTLTDYEDFIADKVNAQICAEWDVPVDGITINAKHKVSRSVIPHGRFTALAREQLWNELIAAREEAPKAQILIRSHAHYFAYCGDSGSLSIITPALQVYTKYGEREVTGAINIGLISIDIDKGKFSWNYHVMKLPSGVRRVWKPSK